MPHYALFLGRGSFYVKVGKLELAIADLNQAIELRPNSPAPYVERGRILLGMGRLERALNDFDRAVELDPYNAQLYHERGVINETAGNDDQALEDYTEAIRLDKDLIQSYLNRGRMYYRRALADGIADTGSELPWLLPGLATLPYDFGHNFENAYYDFSDAYYADNSNVEAYVSFKKLFILLGDYGYVAQSHHPAFKEADPKPETAGVFAVRGWAYRELGKYEDAIADFTVAIELDPGISAYYRDRGIAHYLNGGYDEAIADYLSAIAIDPRDPYLYMFRGLAHNRKDEYDRAVIDYDTAVALNPDDPYFYFFRSVALKSLGEENEYQKYFDLLSDKYDITLALTLLAPTGVLVETQVAAD